MMNWLVDADVTEPLIVSQVQASGGIESEIVIRGQRYRLHTYFTSGNLSIDSTGGEVEVLVVGAGGAGGTAPKSGFNLGTPVFQNQGGAGGGGGGGVLEAKVPFNFAGDISIPVVVGQGGFGDGGDSYIGIPGVGGNFPFAKGGGKGGGFDLDNVTPLTDGADGASGGGGAYLISSALGNATSDGGGKILGQGNIGADATSGNSGGGGGASQTGQGNNEVTAKGGDGVVSSITGVPVYYGGGGGGGVGGFGLAAQGDVGLGGLGGGGKGLVPIGPPGQIDESRGENGKGGGGGGGAIIQTSFGGTGVPGGRGGNGIVIIRYPIEG